MHDWYIVFAKHNFCKSSKNLQNNFKKFQQFLKKFDKSKIQKFSKIHKNSSKNFNKNLKITNYVITHLLV